VPLLRAPGLGPAWELCRWGSQDQHNQQVCIIIQQHIRRWTSIYICICCNCQPANSTTRTTVTVDYRLPTTTTDC